MPIKQLNYHPMKKNMNRMNIICLGVGDMKKALQFYRDGLGLTTGTCSSCNPGSGSRAPRTDFMNL